MEILNRAGKLKARVDLRQDVNIKCRSSVVTVTFANNYIASRGLSSRTDPRVQGGKTLVAAMK